MQHVGMSPASPAPSGRGPGSLERSVRRDGRDEPGDAMRASPRIPGDPMGFVSSLAYGARDDNTSRRRRPLLQRNRTSL